MSRNDKERLGQEFGTENPLHVLIITMSDRAYAGNYEDKSGPAIRDTLEAYFADSPITADLRCVILSDERAELERKLIDARDGDVNLVITTGGTGVGPRDVTPEAVLSVADKVIPGIMEAIRAKYGVEKPRATLSRTVAAVMRNTVVYALPGSPPGVSEYMTEILKTLDHVLCVVNGLDEH